MQTITIELLNPDALALLKQLEKLSVIRVINDTTELPHRSRESVVRSEPPPVRYEQVTPRYERYEQPRAYEPAPRERAYEPVPRERAYEPAPRAYEPAPRAYEPAPRSAESQQAPDSAEQKPESGGARRNRSNAI
ncbi:MAG: hypothetical protein V4543_04525 [Bacteroidota bacterium]